MKRKKWILLNEPISGINRLLILMAFVGIKTRFLFTIMENLLDVLPVTLTSRTKLYKEKKKPYHNITTQQKNRSRSYKTLASQPEFGFLALKFFILATPEKILAVATFVATQTL